MVPFRNEPRLSQPLLAEWVRELALRSLSEGLRARECEPQAGQSYERLLCVAPRPRGRGIGDAATISEAAGSCTEPEAVMRVEGEATSGKDEVSAGTVSDTAGSKSDDGDGTPAVQLDSEASKEAHVAATPSCCTGRSTLCVHVSLYNRGRVIDESG